MNDLFFFLSCLALGLLVPQAIINMVKGDWSHIILQIFLISLNLVTFISNMPEILKKVFRNLALLVKRMAKA